LRLKFAMNKTFTKVFQIYFWAFAFFFASRPLDDGDFWWHLKTGQYIVEQGSIPRTDFFSFTNFGKPWVAHEWLSEVVFYLGYSWFGYNALIFLFAVLAVLAFWLVTRRLNGHAFVTAPAVLLGVWSILPTIGARPRVFTLLFAAAFLALLNSFQRNEKRWHIWLTVPLMAVWVNLHGGFLMGFVLLGLGIVGLVLDTLIEKQSIRGIWNRLRTLGLVFVSCAVAALLNPHGWRIYLFPFEIFLSPVQQQSVRDWLSPNFHQPELLPLAVLILLTIAVLALSPQRPRPSEVLLFVATLFATLKSNRHMAILALVAVPLLIRYLQHWLSAFASPAVLSERPQTSSRAPAFVGALLLLPLLIFVPKLAAEVYGPPKQNVVRVPIKAVQYMKENGIGGPTFTEPNMWGGYLIWALPSNPVYIDGRIDMYGDQFVGEYINIARGTVAWEEPFARHRVQNVIVAPKSHLARSLQDSSDWERRYEDDMSVVFSKRSDPAVAHAAAGE
jgi:hypothetical protein